MRSRWFPSLVMVSTLAALVVVGVRAQDGPSRHDADLMQQKISAIARYGAERTGQTRRTEITESELNAYLKLDAVKQLPEGVVDPSVTILGTGRVSGRAVVDLGAVRQGRNRKSLFDPMNFMGGRLPLTATGVLRTADGVGQFVLESATVASLPVPKSLLQEILGYYSRTPQNPAGIKLDDPFTLPARIREIQVERGQAVVVQ